MKKRVTGKIYAPTETDEQITIVSWARQNVSRYPDLDLLYMINNGNYGGAYRMWNWLLSMGLLPGMTDLALPVGRGSFLGLYMEIKRRDQEKIQHRKPSPQRKRQLELQERLKDAGQRVVEVFSSEQGIAELIKYCRLPKTVVLPF